MDTRRLKPFAQQCRQRLMQGIADRLNYWGFVATSRQPVETLEKLDGGYLFRGQVFDETDVPRRWQLLAGAVQTHGFAHVQETVAYTWFNRLMALKILAHNNYQPDVLSFTRPDTPTPQLLDEARRAQPPYLSEQLYRILRPLLTDYTRETDAFARLLTAYCVQHPVLHRLFDVADDVSTLLLPADMLGESGVLAFINNSTAISEADFKQVELIGWLYQFYIADRKDEVFAGFKKGLKAGPDDIPAATQIFTPRWIVSYLVENTLGRLYLDQNPDSSLGETMRYLVKTEKKPTTVADETGQSREAAPTTLSFNEGALPMQADVSVASLRLIDPACGSGHILVTAFDLLMRIYNEEGYTKRQAVTAILNSHLVGLDLDERAAQLSRFALLLKASQYWPGVWDTDIIPDVWAMPDPWMPTDTDLLSFLGTDGREFLAELHTALRLMQQSQNLGSVMRPNLSRAGRTHLRNRLLIYEAQSDDAIDIFAGTNRQHLRHYIHVLLILTDHYAAVAANPPYINSGSMEAVLKGYIEKHYYRSKINLSLSFMEKCCDMCQSKGIWGLINQDSWLLKTSSVELRKLLLDTNAVESVLHLGPNAFDELGGEVVQTTAATFRKSESHPSSSGIYYDLTMFGSSAKKEGAFLAGVNQFSKVMQQSFAELPGNAISYRMRPGLSTIFKTEEKLGDYADVKQGLSTADNDRFLKLWHEINIHKISLQGKAERKWVPCTKGGSFQKWYGNNEYVINWENNGYELKHFFDKNTKKLRSAIRNEIYYFRKGITWSVMSSGSNGFRILPEGFIFEHKGSACFAKDESDLESIIGFLNSPVAYSLNQALSSGNEIKEGILQKLPYKEPYNATKISPIVQSCTNIARLDWDSRETSWDFAENPLVAIQRQASGSLRQAYETWAAQVAGQFVELHRHEERLNHIFIDLYGLQDELTPEVSPRNITLLPEELDKNQLMAEAEREDNWLINPTGVVTSAIRRDVVARQFISYAVGLLMGRYRLDSPGLHIAHPNATPEELADYTVTRTENGIPKTEPFTIDPDGILPILGEEGGFPDDLGRGLRQILELIWGGHQLTDTVSWLEESLGQSLDKYLTFNFWGDHCRLYQKRPIYWLFSSPKGAFKALVYLHRINGFTVSTLRNKYLLPYIDRLSRQIDHFNSTKSQLGTAENRRIETLRKAYEECRQYDLLLRDAADRQFVPDLDAGVTRNYAQLSKVLAIIK
ncbi:BREX-1 system adenine-specific DNA-methyltransferase PglX [Spirosoma linguale]|uniref:site-specific DNA-methyltransferase (adenine-specific) n=1 Tax=Spirosoma linguale (strain ATCC 33905 / DSM 74 / LMG 10896 / Claus 1) TaxID=504472 RepID=D2QQP4_SPILD|nr:putative restriction enzyme [Spirosoma linguale DSM 74]